MRSAYPLLVDHNGWGVGGHPERGGGNPSVNLLRSIGNDLTRPVPYVGSSSSLRDVEILVNEPPLHSSFSHEYPQPFCDGHVTTTRHQSLRVKRKQTRPSAFNPTSPLPSRSNINRTTHRYEPSLNPDIEVLEIPITHRRSPSSGGNHSPSPRGSTQNVSLRIPSNPSRAEYGQLIRVPVVDSVVDEIRNWNQIENAPVMPPMGEIGTHSTYALSSNVHPNQFVLCCTPPSYYYSTERLRQEPEPGLCDCCDHKVSCCCPCARDWCPSGNVNSVCTSIICFGIITFIVLSPLFHYLVPS